ncbi:MAG TPA: hypothetical protein PK823_19410 [Novosphingobium sp.]|nr:hypothetical protein [Novosphingobium sp.]
MPDTQVRPTIHSKMDVSARIAAGWARVIVAVGKGKFADKLEIDAKTVGRALSGENLPELHTAFNSLAIDPTALDEVAALYGVEIRRKQSVAANDMETVADLSHLVGKWVEALSDGHRCHRATLELALVMRPLLQRLNAVCAEADALRGVA